MTRFSVTWEGTCREEKLSPSQIVELLEEETSELRSFQMNSIHSLAIICDELDDDSPKDSSPPDTVSLKVHSKLGNSVDDLVSNFDLDLTDRWPHIQTNSNTEAMRVVIEEVKSNDSNSTLEDVSSIDDLNTTVNNDFSKNPLPEQKNGCCTPEEPGTEDPVAHKEIPLESIDKMLVKLGKLLRNYWRHGPWLIETLRHILPSVNEP